MNNRRLKPNTGKNEIAVCMHKCKEHLLMCEDRCRAVTDGIAETSADIKNNYVERHDRRAGQRHYAAFPQVQRLEEHCAVFLSNAKLSIQSLAELVHSFYGTGIHLPRFDRILSWFQCDPARYAKIISYLQVQQAGLKYIVDLRNYQEHPTRKKMLTLRNFTLLPDETVALPQWQITGEDPARIDEDMGKVVAFLIHFAEVLFLICLLNSIDDTHPFVVREVDDSELDPACPIKYFVVPALLLR
jgi:hypothetical protein